MYVTAFFSVEMNDVYQTENTLSDNKDGIR